MTIREFQQKCKYYRDEYVTEEILVVAIIILVGFGGFGLGRLSVVKENMAPVTIEHEQMTARSSAALSAGEDDSVPDAGGLFVASKGGSKYHFPWCSGAERIKEENKIWFESKEAAEKAGYTPAANCKGLTDSP